MPMPSEHSCRLRSPGDFKPDSFKRVSRKSDGKTYHIIMGRLSGEDTMTEQAYRYPKDSWPASEAKAHCKGHDGKTFEPASESKSRWGDADDSRAESAIERRTFDFDELRVEPGDDGKPTKITGHAAVFNQLSEPLGGFRERVRPGAFRKTLREADVRSLFNHDPNYILGRTKSKTLRLREDATGLWYEADPPDTQWARDLMTSIDRGDIDQSSFQFHAVKDEMTIEHGETVRELVEVRLFDVSPVTFPVYPQTDVQVRSLLLSLGMDWDALSGALARAERGVDLTATDHDIIKSSIEALTSYLPAEPVQGDHSEAADGGSGQVPRLLILRRQCQIADRDLV